MSIVYRFSRVVALVIFAGVTILAFFGALAALKEFTRADIDYFLDLSSPPRCPIIGGRDEEGGLNTSQSASKRAVLMP